MKSRLMFLFVLCLVINCLKAQTNFQDIIESEKVKDEITFVIIGGDLHMYIDNSLSPKKVLKEINLQGKSNQIVFNSEFINPLKHRLSLNNKIVDDELTKAAESYLSTFTNYITHVAKNNEAFGTGDRPFMTQSSKTEKVTITNPHLIDLVALLSLNKPNYFTEDVNKEFLKELSLVNDLEVQNDIMKDYEKIFINTYNIDKYKDIETKLNENKQISDGISNKITSISNNYKDLNNVVEPIVNNLSVSEDINDKNIANLIKSKIKRAESDHAAFLKSKEELDSKYKAFKNLLDEIKDNTYKKTEKTIIDNIIFQKGKRNEITIYLKTFDYDSEKKTLKEKEEKTFLISLRKHRTFIPVVASGVLYTNLSFNTFGTETNDMGQTLVAQGNDKENEIAIGAYLNLYLNNGWESPLFLQFGVGPSKEKPLLFAGFGINIASRVNLSFGSVFTWSPTLDELNVGDTVSGTTQIEDDIVYEFTSMPKFYLGISFNLTK